MPTLQLVPSPSSEKASSSPMPTATEEVLQGRVARQLESIVLSLQPLSGLVQHTEGMHGMHEIRSLLMNELIAVSDVGAQIHRMLDLINQASLSSHLRSALMKLENTLREAVAILEHETSDRVRAAIPALQNTDRVILTTLGIAS